MTISEEDGAIVSLDWGWGRDQQPNRLLSDAASQLNEYLDGVRTDFRLPLRASGSPYRRRVWNAIMDVSFGRTSTYGQLAAVAGGVARSIGQACRDNPIPIFIPCHRIVGATALGGYLGGEGVEVKEFLLDHERRIVAQSFSTVGD
jgi:methylated-DNA-[protein]-cysteine S-methyltransferase